MEYVWIDSDNAEDYTSVLPKELTLSDDHFCIGIADDDNTLCGAICYRYLSYQYDILWLYVVEEKRRQHFGWQLMDIVFKVVGASGDIYPISVMFDADKEDTLYPFFLAYDKMEVSFSHDRYILKPKDVYGALFPPEVDKIVLEQTPFFSLSEGGQKNILHYLKREEGYTPESYENWKRDIVPDLCRCIIKNGNLSNVVFVHKRPEGNLELSFIYSRNPLGLVELLLSTAWDIEEKYPEAKVYFDAVSEEAEKLARKLLPHIKAIPIYEALW